MGPVLQRHRVAFLGWLTTVATSLSFVPALSDRRYLVVGAIFAGLVVATGVALRRFRVPALLVFVAQLTVLVQALLLAFGTSLRYGVVPTDKTVVGLQDLLRTGVQVSQDYAAPAPRDSGLLLMVVFFVAVVAALVDLLAVGLARVPLAGLPLLALYTVPVAALPEGLPWFAFLPGAACFLATLMADERLRLASWGRLVTRTPTEPVRAVDLASLRNSGRRISFIALSTALIVPLFVPSLSSSILDRNRNPGLGGDGGSTVSFGDPMVSLAESLQRNDPVDLLAVSSEISPEYLRMTVLNRPGENAWSADPVVFDETTDLRNTLPGPTGLSRDVAMVQHGMQITLADDFPSDSAWLPVPFAANFVGAGEDFAYVVDDQTVTVRTRSATDSLPPYEVDYVALQPTPEQLRSSGQVPADIANRYGEVPAGVPAIVEETAREVTAAAQSPYEQAVLLQSYFRDLDRFTYDLDTGYGYGYDAMKDFLEVRAGFCQHFAATMAMMARTLGIPSRVVVGFLKSERLQSEDNYVFTSDNVHSWPELYFEGLGWVRFEPTPGVNAPFPDYAQRAENTAAVSTAPASSAANDPTLGRDPDAVTSSAAPVGGNSASSGGGGNGLPSRGWLVLLGLLLLAAAPWLLRRGVRHARLTRPIDAASSAEAAWIELRDSMVDLGIPWTGSMTPRARERSIAPHLDADPSGRAALRRLALSVERARYAEGPLDGSSPATDVRDVAAALSSGVSRTRRVKALLLPASLLPDLRNGWDRMRDRLQRPAPASDGASTSR